MHCGTGTEGKFRLVAEILGMECLKGEKKEVVKTIVAHCRAVSYSWLIK